MQTIICDRHQGTTTTKNTLLFYNVLYISHFSVQWQFKDLSSSENANYDINKNKLFYQTGFILQHLLKAN